MSQALRTASNGAPETLNLLFTLSLPHWLSIVSLYLCLFAPCILYYKCVNQKTEKSTVYCLHSKL